MRIEIQSWGIDLIAYKIYLGFVDWPFVQFHAMILSTFLHRWAVLKAQQNVQMQVVEASVEHLGQKTILCVSQMMWRRVILGESNLMGTYGLCSQGHATMSKLPHLANILQDLKKQNILPFVKQLRKAMAKKISNLMISLKIKICNAHIAITILQVLRYPAQVWLIVRYKKPSRFRQAWVIRVELSATQSCLPSNKKGLSKQSCQPQKKQLSVSYQEIWLQPKELSLTSLEISMQNWKGGIVIVIWRVFEICHWASQDFLWAWLQWCSPLSSLSLPS